MTEPLKIDLVAVGAGRIGLTHCPGRTLPSPGRDLAADLDAIAATGARLVVTLVEAHELELLGVASLGADLARRGIAWHHLPIVDFGVPDSAFEAAWNEAGADIHARLDRGETLVVHCRGGLGRTGTIAARLMVERGADPEEAMAAIRTARPGTIETAAQEKHVRQAAGRRPA